MPEIIASVEEGISKLPDNIAEKTRLSIVGLLQIAKPPASNLTSEEQCAVKSLRLRSSAGSTPLLYGLPKIHKPEVPLRPIASFYTSPTYQLSKHLVHLLSPLVGNTSSHIKNSKDFAAFISDQTIPEDKILVSFDVTSLFTNVPVNLACSVAQSRLENDPTLHDRTSLSSTEILRLLHFCLNATYLCFQGTFYKQTFGTAMGSPVSVTVADLVMEDVERALSSFHTPPQYFGSGMSMIRVLPSVKTTLTNSMNTSTPLKLASNSPMKLRMTIKFHSWTQRSYATMMDPYLQLSTENPPTLINTLPSHLTTLLPKNFLLSTR